MRRIPRIVGRLLLLLLSTGLAILLAEQLLRFADYYYSPMRIENMANSDHRYKHVFKDRHFIFDPQTIWTPRPNASVFNSQGFRGPVLPPEKTKDVIRIFAVGDSNTLGWAKDDNANWPEFIGNLLNRGGSHVEMVNAGVWGYSTYQGKERLRQVTAWHPDLVLISFGANDAHRVVLSDRDYARRVTREQHLHRYRLGQLWLSLSDKRLMKRLTARSEAIVPRVSVPQYRRNLDEIVSIARQHRIRLLFLTRPFMGKSPNPTWWKNFITEYNAATREVAARHGIPCIEVAMHFADKEYLFADESHFTSRGHMEMAHLVLPFIRDIYPHLPAPQP